MSGRKSVITSYSIHYTKLYESDAEILVGGESNNSVGYFIRPTLIQVKRPDYVTMCEEIFGPVLSVYVYPDAKWDETFVITSYSIHYTKLYDSHRG